MASKQYYNSSTSHIDSDYHHYNPDSPLPPLPPHPPASPGDPNAAVSPITSPYEDQSYPSYRTQRLDSQHSILSEYGAALPRKHDSSIFADSIPLQPQAHGEVDPDWGAHNQYSQPQDRLPGPMGAVGDPGKKNRLSALLTSKGNRTWVVWILTFVQVGVFIGEIIKNSIVTGSPIMIHPQFNPMIGPSTYVLINTGARFVPCMRSTPGIQDSTTPVLWPCPNTTSSDTNDPSNRCNLADLCGFGLQDNVPEPNQWYRFIIPIFLHAGLVHIGFNMLLQWLLGRDMEKSIGSIRFALVYFSSGIFGFVLGGNFAPPAIASTGASGSLFGILALTLIDLLYTWKKRPKPLKDLALIGVDVVISFVLGLLPGLDNFSHIGGFLMGLVLGICILHSPTALRERIGQDEPPYTPITTIANPKGAVTQTVGFFKGRKPLWWAWWLIRAGALVGVFVSFILLLRNFYLNRDVCTWCKYLSCLPINNWCELGATTEDIATFAKEYYIQNPPPRFSFQNLARKVKRSTCKTSGPISEDGFGISSIVDAQGAAGGGDLGASANAVDRDLLRAIWKWLMQHPDIQVGKDKCGNNLSFEEMEILENAGVDAAKDIDEPKLVDNEEMQAPAKHTTAASKTTSSNKSSVGPPAPAKAPLKVFVCQERMWYALTGHSVDWNRVPRSEFVCLSAIARHRDDGILQVHLIRETGQDKRSLPKRTDALCKKGYIQKRAVYCQGYRTSHLVLQRFAQAPKVLRIISTAARANGKNEATKGDSQAIDELIDIRRFIEKIFEELKISNIITSEDFKYKLGLTCKKNVKAFVRAIQKLELFGCVRRVTATSATSSPGRSFKCIKFIREPTELEIEIFCSPHPSSRHSMNENVLDPAVDEDDEEEGTLPQHGSLIAPKGGNQLRELGRTLPQWKPNLVMGNFLFKIVESSGDAGISTMDIKHSIVGKFYSRPIDSTIGRFCDNWTLSQPPHLYHRALIRDISQTGKFNHYNYFTYPNFSSLVSRGLASWDALKSSMVKNKRMVEPPILEAKLDCYGFPIEALGESKMPLTLIEAMDDLIPEINQYIFRTPVLTKLDDGSFSADWSGQHAVAGSKEIVAADRARVGLNKSLVPRGRPRKYPKGEEPYNPVYKAKLRAEKAAKALEAKIARENKKKGITSKSSNTRVKGKTANKRGTSEAGLDEPVSNSTRSAKRTRPSDQLEQINEDPMDINLPQSETASITGSLTRVGTESLVEQPLSLISGRQFEDSPMQDSTGRVNSVFNGSLDIINVHPNLSTKAMPGGKISRVLIDPPGSQRIKKGRRKKSMIAVFASDRLKELSFFAAACEPIPAESAKKACARGPYKKKPHLCPGISVVIINKQHRNDMADISDQSANQFRFVNPPSSPTSNTPVRKFPETEDSSMDQTLENVVSQIEPSLEVPPKELHSQESHGSLKNNTISDQFPIISSLNANIKELHLPSGTSEQCDPEPSQDIQIHSPNLKKETGKRIRKSGASSIGPPGGHHDTLLGGTLVFQRKKIVLDLLEKCGGAFPGDKDLWYAYSAVWMRNRPAAAKPDLRISKNVQQSLVSAGQIKVIKFTFKNSKGLQINKALLTLPDVAPDSIVVRELQMKMKEQDGVELYYPPEAEIPSDIKATLENRIVRFSPAKLPQETENYVVNRMDIPARREEEIRKRQALEELGRQRIEETRKKRKIRQDLAAAQKQAKKIARDAKRQGAAALYPRAEKRRTGKFTDISGLIRNNALGTAKDNPYLKSLQDSCASYGDTAPSSFGDISHLLYRSKLFGLQVPKSRLNFDSAQWTSGVLFVPPPVVANLSLRPCLKGTREMWSFHVPGPESFDPSYDLVQYATLTHPAQKFHKSSGTFSSEFFVTRSARQDKWVQLDQDQAFSQWMPSNLQDIISVPRKERKSTTENYGEPIFAKFSREVQLVEDWEVKNRNLLTNSLKDQDGKPELRFINHTIPSMHCYDERMIKTIEFNSENIFTLDTPSKAFGYPADSDEDSKQLARVETALSKKKDSAWHIRREKAAQRREFLLTKSRQLYSHGAYTSERPEIRDPQVNHEKALKPSRRRRTRFNLDDKVFPPEAFQRLVITAVAVSLLTGGLDKHIDWVLVATVFPEYGMDVILKKWRQHLKNSRAQIEHFQTMFQGILVEAYERGDVPPLNCDKPLEYDWATLVDWLEGKLQTSDNHMVSTLPAERRKIEEKFEIIEEVGRSIFCSDQYFGADVSWKILNQAARITLLAEQSYNIPVSPPLPKAEANRERLIIAKSWIRANLLMPASEYSMAKSSKKLHTLGEKLLSEALEIMVKAKVISHANKGRQIPGRNYDVTELFLSAMKSTLPPTTFQKAVGYKLRLDDIFASHEVAMFSYYTEDSEVLALTNLVAHGRVKLVPANVPFCPYGLTEGHYKTRVMDKMRLFFEIQIVPTDTYIYGIPVQPLPPPPGLPAGVEEPPMPLWIDLFGNLFPQMWHKALGAVLNFVALRPGTLVERLVIAMSPAMEEWEINILLGWLVDSKVMRRLGDGYTVEEWWWMVMGGPAQG
ncbi:MAG: hypothetical protein M1829_006776 [Trizodia sp. TS-e1964]|nr:MAG: hypothetical protein M1829_006776 [Trizodia sp. TS-e1964]